jgi:hypothetical protein
MGPAVEAAIIAGSVGVLTLIGTLAAQYYGIRRTSRDTLNARFATAADKLGSEAPAVRLAGIYAMTGLADDWPENRQTCVEVLCGYLRRVRLVWRDWLTCGVDGWAAAATCWLLLLRQELGGGLDGVADR